MVRTAPLVALAFVALAGCGSGATSPNPTAGTSGPTISATPTTGTTAATGAWDDPSPAVAAAKVGTGTPCGRSLTFGVPANWKPTGNFAAGGMSVAGLDLVCEVDGKPAGVLGVMRVFRGTDKSTDLTTVGSAFVNGLGPASAVEVRDITVAGAPAVELSYRSNDHKTRAFLVRVKGITYAVQWGGLDDDEHTGGLPAYVLARTSAKD